MKEEAVFVLFCLTLSYLNIHASLNTSSWRERLDKDRTSTTDQQFLIARHHTCIQIQKTTRIPAPQLAIICMTMAVMLPSVAWRK